MNKIIIKDVIKNKIKGSELENCKLGIEKFNNNIYINFSIDINKLISIFNDSVGIIGNLNLDINTLEAIISISNYLNLINNEKGDKK